MQLTKEEQTKLASHLQTIEQEFKATNPKAWQERSLLEHETYLNSKYLTKERYFIASLNKAKNTDFEAILAPERWILKIARKGNGIVHANDITRLQYLKLANIHHELKSNLPQEIVLEDIINKATFKTLTNCSPQNAATLFNTTIHSKRIAYLLRDFGLALNDIIIDQTGINSND